MIRLLPSLLVELLPDISASLAGWGVEGRLVVDGDEAARFHFHFDVHVPEKQLPPHRDRPGEGPGVAENPAPRPLGEGPAPNGGQGHDIDKMDDTDQRAKVEIGLAGFIAAECPEIGPTDAGVDQEGAAIGGPPGPVLDPLAT